MHDFLHATVVCARDRNGKYDKDVDIHKNNLSILGANPGGKKMEGSSS